MSDPGSFDVVQGLWVFGVTVDRTGISVDVYGSDPPVCGTVTFTFEHRKERAGRAALLRRWQQRHTPVTLITGADTVTLLSEKALLDRIAVDATSDLVSPRDPDGI